MTVFTKYCVVLSTIIVALIILVYSCEELHFDGSGGKMDRTLCDMRALAEALHNYHLSYDRYPQWAVGEYSVNKSEIPSMHIANSQYFRNIKPYGGTTNGYTSQGYFRDVYTTNGATFSYYSTDTACLIWSSSFDGKYDVTSAVLLGIPSFDYNALESYFMPYQKRSKMDIKATGDIIRIVTPH